MRIVEPLRREFAEALAGAPAAFGLVVYYAARYWRRGAGVNVELVYRELPPD